MSNLYILGASGAVGQIYTDSAINSKIYKKIILISSSTLGYQRLKKFSVYSNVSLLKLDDLNLHCVSSGKNFFVNFAFAQGGLPWVNISNGRKLLNLVTNFVLKNKFSRYIEISSQSVFGYNFTSDVSYLSSKPYFIEDYGLQKSIAEDIVVAKLSGSIPYTILRLGNVLFDTSGPFYQRVLQIYHSEYRYLLDSNGYTNFTFIENVIKVINHVLINMDIKDIEPVYHISEANSITWSTVYNILLNSDEAPIHSCHSGLNNAKISKLFMFLKSPYSRPLYDFLSYLNFSGFNKIVEKKYKSNRQLNYPLNMVLDKSTFDSFSSNSRFLPYFPLGFRFAISPEFFIEKLKIIYEKK